MTSGIGGQREQRGGVLGARDAHPQRRAGEGEIVHRRVTLRGCSRCSTTSTATSRRSTRCSPTPARRAPTRYLIGGDVALFGPWPEATVARLRELAPATWIRGNGERWTADPDAAPEPVRRRDRAPRARRSATTLVAELDALPESAPLGDGTRAWHGSPVSDVRSFVPEPADDEAELLDGVAERRLVFGHTHLPFARTSAVGGIELVNPGSVGMPFDGDHRAAYALLHDDGTIEHRRVAYDHAAVPAALRERYGDAAWLSRPAAPLHRTPASSGAVSARRRRRGRARPRIALARELLHGTGALRVSIALDGPQPAIVECERLRAIVVRDAAGTRELPHDAAGDVALPELPFMRQLPAFDVDAADGSVAGALGGLEMLGRVVRDARRAAARRKRRRRRLRDERPATCRSASPAARASRSSSCSASRSSRSTSTSRATWPLARHGDEAATPSAASAGSTPTTSLESSRARARASRRCRGWRSPRPRGTRAGSPRSARPAGRPRSRRRPHEVGRLRRRDRPEDGESERAADLLGRVDQPRGQPRSSGETPATAAIVTGTNAKPRPTAQITIGASRLER